MDKLNLERQLRAIALEAASRIVAENLPKFISLGTVADNKKNTKLAVIDLAEGFRRYIEEGGR